MITINKRGSNLIYIVILMTVLGILVAGYASISIYSASSVADARQYQQDYVTAHSLREVFVQMAVQNYPEDVVGSATKSDMDNFVGTAVESYTDYLAKLEAYEESLQEQEQILWQTGSNPAAGPIQKPIFENYENTITAEANLPEGILTHTHTIHLIEEAGSPKCWMIIEIDFKANESNKEYHLGARLEPNPQFSKLSPKITEWEVVRYYETD